MSAIVQLRPARADDEALIYSSWLRSYWNATMKGVVEYIDYIRGQRARIDRMLAAHGALVACSPSDDTVIMGWACLGGGGLHYVYVRHLYRNQGVATSLITYGPPRSVTHMTPVFGKAFRGWTYNPYLLEIT